MQFSDVFFNSFGQCLEQVTLVHDTKFEKAVLRYISVSPYRSWTLRSSCCETGLVSGRLSTFNRSMQVEQLSMWYCLMRYPSHICNNKHQTMLVLHSKWVYFLFLCSWIENLQSVEAQVIMAHLLYWKSSQIISSTILYPFSASFFIFCEIKTLKVYNFFLHCDNL